MTAAAVGGRAAPRGLLLLAAVAAACVARVNADEYTHKYVVGDAVRLWVNKVGPFNNPQETYNYYELPFCKRDEDAKPVHKWGGLGEVLEGNELIDSQLELKFRSDQERTTICEQTLDDKTARRFRDAVMRHYWYEFFMDDLPIWGFVGEFAEGAEHGGSGKSEAKDEVFMYTHRSFDINYNGDQIIQVNLTSENPQPIKAGTKLQFTYSVKWEPTPIHFSRRFERYLDYNFFEHQIHWFSIFNSFMMVIFLTGLVSMILMRTLRNDYARYASEEDDLDSLDRNAGEESGWKLVHGDVFRPPKQLPLLSALIGTGAQLCLLTFTVIGITIAGSLFEGRGAIMTAIIVCYALTSFVSGYISGGFNSRNSGRAWIKAMLLTATLFPGVCFAIALVLNTIAIAYHSLAAVPFGTIVVVFFLWSFISIPLVLLGTVIGRNWAGTPDHPCRVKSIPRPIPARAWYLTPPVIGALGGLLPFGSIFIEMYFIFTSFWNYKVYYVYGFFLLVFVILLIVTLCVTIVATYFLLNAENYHWHWTSFTSAAGTAAYVYVYALYYFLFKTKMTGFFQTAFYFGYTAIFCAGLGTMCGAVGYLGANLFVRRIYRNIKAE